MGPVAAGQGDVSPPQGRGRRECGPWRVEGRGAGEERPLAERRGVAARDGGRRAHDDRRTAGDERRHDRDDLRPPPRPSSVRPTADLAAAQVVRHGRPVASGPDRDLGDGLRVLDDLLDRLLPGGFQAATSAGSKREGGVDWPGKAGVTFSDALTAVRRWRRREWGFPTSRGSGGHRRTPPAVTGRPVPRPGTGGVEQRDLHQSRLDVAPSGRPEVELCGDCESIPCGAHAA